MIFSTRKLLAQFFGFSGDPNRVVFTQNATDSMNIALKGLLRAGDHVVISQLDHNAVLRPVNHMKRDLGIEATVLKSDACGKISIESVEAAISDKTKAIVINHASNVVGVVQDLAAIASVARQHGVLVIVDTAQTAGVLDVDMADGIDVLTFTGHKGLFGPMGIGGMIIAEDVELQASRFGGTGMDSISEFQPDSYPHRLEAGTISIPGVAGLHAAQKWFAELGQSMLDESTTDHAAKCRAARHHIHTTESAHSTKIWNHLSSIERVSLMGERSNQNEYVATLSFLVDGMSAQQMAEMLDADAHICVRAGLHCAPAVHSAFGTADAGGAVRISPGYFTEKADVDHLLESITQLLQ